MSFSEQLNQYMEELSCTGKELAQYSELSEAVISRYRKGERAPIENGVHLQKLARGIALVSEKKQICQMDEQTIYRTLQGALSPEKRDGIILSERLNQLIEELQINVSRMAVYLHYDASYISKVRTGKRNPSNPQVLLRDVSKYVAEQFSDENGKERVASLVGCSVELLQTEESYLEQLEQWLGSNLVEKPDYVSGFLRKVDEFDLDDYIRAIHFDTLKVPRVPFQLPVSRHYYGLKEMREGELDFFKHVVLSKSMEPLYLCSDMPVEDMASDEEFARKFMFGIAMTLKKGLHINMIHNVERPMKEMMLGLENWIPMYMTGQVSPYYIKGVQNQVYSHLHYSSGTAAMNGDCISGHHDMAHYYFTTNKEEAAFYRKNMEFLLKKASPLMDIYREESKSKLDSFLDEEGKVRGKRHRILAAPPLFAMKEERLKRILGHSNVTEKEKEEILLYHKKQKRRIREILSHSILQDEIAEISPEEYEKHPVSLSLAECYLEKDVFLTYEEYCSCINDAECLHEEQDNYEFHLTKVEGFRNISITCFEGRWCLVSKNKAPSIHFVIRHPHLRNALENVVLPVRDEKAKGLK